ncbi:SAM-dependent methyltransferase [Mycolicibacterium sp. BK556]|uniref:class I SAM-dependent methyltransferase n=2 Tax=Mycobacteriaceae TaxID=1762 RepID=UPI0010ED71D9|nr:class I SAM-dependent methyltransferase [Mycobacterium sp. BK086]MBB3606948.1 SAM-dependent methyltransferase [Mycolicibacterium sp. BK556]MBB3636705.1 SAM-dependent methyltransferase [Mycolicibacterium sp. BK607]MBB3752992.1 SAM-dependent methyltransferase [Mycolicibacterium sp. BK634]TDO09240.1 methyltransferase family protein [Mycobacterium sp. BK086]
MNINQGLVMLADAMPGVNRIRAVQQALAMRSNPVYLEIGVSRGQAFQRISADVKFAVDPAFRLTERTREAANAKGRVVEYFETTSDAFFENEKALLEQHPVDVALIDGLHTYEQVVRDVENTVRHLKDDGVIFLHDCNPPFELAGRRAESWDEFMAQQSGPLKIGIWNGDVWKAIVELRSTRPDLLVGVLKCDQGVGFVRKGSPESTLPYSPEQVEALTYADLKADRTRLLNLKPPRYLGEFLAMSGAR